MHALFFVLCSAIDERIERPPVVRLRLHAHLRLTLLVRAGVQSLGPLSPAQGTELDHCQYFVGGEVSGLESVRRSCFISEIRMVVGLRTAISLSKKLVQYGFGPIANQRSCWQ